VALPHASTSLPSALKIRMLEIGGRRFLEQDQLVAANAGAAVGQSAGDRAGHRREWLRARIEHDEVVPEAVHLGESGAHARHLRIARG
jgi:hypothetical protein